MKYSDDEKVKVFDSICKAISEEGLSLRKALIKNNLTSDTFYRWIDEDESQNLSLQYVRACDIRTEMKFDSIEEDYMTQPQRDADTNKIDNAWVSLQKLKIDSKKWELSKMNPKKYGDKVDVKTEGTITISFED